MFFEKYEFDIVTYAGNSKPHTCDSDLYTVLSKLRSFQSMAILCHLTQDLTNFSRGNL